MRRSSAAMPLQQHARRLAVLQQRQRLLHHRQHGQRFLVLAAGALAELHDAALEAVEVGEHQFGLDRLGVGDRIDAALDMGDVVILEAAQHVHDGVDLADVGEELVAQPFALRGAAHQAGDVDEGDAGRDDLLRLGDRGDLLQARIGHRHLAGVRLDGAERIVGGLRGGRLVSALKSVDLPTLGKPNDAAFETHVDSVLSGIENLIRAMGERIDDRQAFDALPVLQILGKEIRAAEFQRGSEQQAIPPGIAIARCRRAGFTVCRRQRSIAELGKACRHTKTPVRCRTICLRRSTSVSSFRTCRLMRRLRCLAKARARPLPTGLLDALPVMRIEKDVAYRRISRCRLSIAFLGLSASGRRRLRPIWDRRRCAPALPAGDCVLFRCSLLVGFNLRAAASAKFRYAFTCSRSLNARSCARSSSIEIVTFFIGVTSRKHELRVLVI